jgi:hypothetical protein
MGHTPPVRWQLPDRPPGCLALFFHDFYSFSAAGHELAALFGAFFFHQQLAFTAP